MKTYDILLHLDRPETYTVLMGRDTVSGEIIIAEIPFHEVRSFDSGIVLATDPILAFTRYHMSPQAGVVVGAAVGQDPGLRYGTGAETGLETAASAEVWKLSLIDNVSSGIQTAAEDVKASLIVSVGETDTALYLGTMDVDAIAKGSVGDAVIGTELSFDVSGQIKTVYEALAYGTELDMSVSENIKHVWNECRFGMTPGTAPTGLCRKYFLDAAAGVLTSAFVEDTDIHYSLGDGITGITLFGEVTPGAVKAVEVCSGIIPDTSCRSDVISFVSPAESGIVIGGSCGALRRRYRLLHEADGMPLSAMDSMTLNDLDYVELDQM